MDNRTKLKLELIICPVLALLLIGLCIALPFYRPLGDSVSFKEFVKTRPLFIKYLLADRRNDRNDALEDQLSA